MIIMDKGYDVTGSGVTPVLGKTSTMEGLARPGGKLASGNKVPKPAPDAPKVARPGGRQAVGKNAPSAPANARPGGAQSAKGR